jgi:hypothetical protein
LNNFATITHSGNDACPLTLHEFQTAKFLLDGILNDLRSRGPAEVDLVKRYRFQKFNNLQGAECSEDLREINSLLVTALSSLLSHRLGSHVEETVNLSIIPALISID